MLFNDMVLLDYRDAHFFLITICDSIAVVSVNLNKHFSGKVYMPTCARSAFFSPVIAIILPPKPKNI